MAAWTSLAGTGGPKHPRIRATANASGTLKRCLITSVDGICFGLDPVAVDLTGSGRLDLVCGGRNGLYWLENMGKGSGVANGFTKDPLGFPSYEDHLKLLVYKDETG